MTSPHPSPSAGPGPRPGARPRPRIGVIGTGTIGTMAAWRAAERGAEVVAFDRDAPGHDRGAAGGESRIFRTAYLEGRRYIPLLQRAEGLWRELEDRTGHRLLDLCGGLSIGPTDDPRMREIVEGAEEYGLDHRVLTPEEAAKRFPQHPVGAGETAVLDPRAGVVRPDAALLAAAARAEELGARIHRYTEVEGVERRGAGWSVTAGGRRHDLDRLVLALGPWSAAPGTFAHGLLASAGLQARQIPMTWFPAREPDALIPGPNPVAIRVGDYGYSCFPVMDGVSVKVSPHSAPRPAVGHPGELPPRAAPDVVATARETVRRHLPGLHPDPSRTAVYADLFSPDGHALLGPLPGSPGVVLATGFSGHGFKLSPLFGEVIADLAIDGETAYDIGHLDPARLLGAAA
ncbi:FAD-dependent oxidoreductase [Streptomonospora sp. S1-112]|uniref:FAD-dependent oxidoreductase n=1 Tax=Streptomonospora mangrovi TaxID=2883123 RepID=A0A9X3SDB3_9ACTN|nr:FAD-dependent oxidoreductase [Streptomonospora mangrovi]MDA0563637.1 FAD-dependent oxidoreductase [Streptomonospora mangrovi]